MCRWDRELPHRDPQRNVFTVYCCLEAADGHWRDRSDSSLVSMFQQQWGFKVSDGESETVRVGT